MGRAAGFSGQRLEDAFFPKGYGYAAPGWMSALGLTPEAAMSSVQNLGVLPNSVGNAEGAARGLGSLRFRPSLGGLDLDRTMRQGAGYGLFQVGEQGVAGYGNQIEKVMEDAVNRGVDRSTLLRSINTGISMQARSGAIVMGPQATGSFLEKFMDLPGGRTGELGFQTMGGLEQAGGMVGTQPLQTIAAMMAARKIKTESQLASFLGMSGEQFSAYKATPQGRRFVGAYFQVQGKDDYGAGMALTNLSEGNPTARANMFNQPELTGEGVIPSVYSTRVLQSLTQSPTAGGAVSLTLGGGATYPASELNSLGIGGGFSEKDVDSYRAGLIRRGIKPDLIEAMISAGREFGVNPLVPGAVMKTESSLGYGTGKSGAGQWTTAGWKDQQAWQNPLQVTPGTGADMGRIYGHPEWSNAPSTPQEGIRMGFATMAQKLKQSGGDVNRAI